MRCTNAPAYILSCITLISSNTGSTHLTFISSQHRHKIYFVTGKNRFFHSTISLPLEPFTIRRIRRGVVNPFDDIYSISSALDRDLQDWLDGSTYSTRTRMCLCTIDLLRLPRHFQRLAYMQQVNCSALRNAPRVLFHLTRCCGRCSSGDSDSNWLRRARC